MKKLSSPEKASYICIAAAFAGIIITTLALNAMCEYDAVRPVEFFIVPVCALFAAIGIKKSGAEGAIMLTALCLTICADFVMVILEDYYPISLAFFSAAQLAYYARILFVRKAGAQNFKYLTASVCARAAVCACIVAAATLILPQEKLLAALAAFYFANLAANFTEACLLCAKRTRGNVQDTGPYAIFAAGLALFICCDICVALNAADTAGIDMPANLLYAISLLIWIFYAPSQALLALSVKRGLICRGSAQTN